MTRGKIVRLVRTYGSRWGLIEPFGSTTTLFFNRASLQADADFASLQAGQIVEFDEEPDRATGARAVRVLLGDLPKMKDGG